MIGLAVAAVFAIGSFVQVVAGFGSALVIMPVLTQFVGIKTAASVLALTSAAVSVTVLYQNRHGLRWREAVWLMASAAVGVPLGTLALKQLPAGPVVALLGLVLIGYGLYSVAMLWRGSEGNDEDAAEAVADGGTRAGRLGAVAAGLCAGLLGGAYATDGPPLVIYGAMRRWPKDAFRSILQACFLLDGALIVLCHGAGGLVTRDVLMYCLYGVPGMALGLLAGTLLDPHIDRAAFHRLLIGLILALGVGLLASAAWAQ